MSAKQNTSGEAEDSDKPPRSEGDHLVALLPDLPHVAVLGHGADEAITHWNPTCESLYGHTAAEALGQSFVELLIAPAQRESARRSIAEGIRTGRMPPPSEMRLLHKNGSLAPVYSCHSIVRRAGAEPVFFRIDIDLCDVKKTEEHEARIRELEKHKSEMEKIAATGRIAAGVAHEINNPLTGIKNSFYIIKKAIPLDHPDYGYVRIIDNEIERIRRIVLQMYNLYRPESEKPSPVLLSVLLDEVSLIFGSKIKRQRLRLTSEIPPGLNKILVPGGNLRQILHNLLLNAIQASPLGGEIRFEVREEGGNLCISISDEGEGIPRDIQERIFEPFFTTKNAQQDAGMGLGLAVSRSLAVSMGGDIAVRSEPGRGSSFTATLPREESGPEEKDTGVPAPHADSAVPRAGDAAIRRVSEDHAPFSSHKEDEAPGPAVARAGNAADRRTAETAAGRTAPVRILVADDEECVLHTICDLLKRQGWECESVADGFQALDRLRREGSFHVLLAAHNIPGNEDLELLEAVRRELPELPVILMTSQPSLETAIAALRHRAFDYMPKPLDPECLFQRIREILLLPVGYCAGIPSD